MVTLRHEEQKINMHDESIPTTLPKVDSAFHSQDDVSEMSNRADSAMHAILKTKCLGVRKFRSPKESSSV